MFESHDFLTIILLVVLEGLLSADNAMVLAVLVLGLPQEDQQKALRYGIFGAVGFRIITTIAAAGLIHLNIVKLLGGLYLLYLPFKYFWLQGPVEERRGPARAKPWLGLSAFWATVVKVELTDIVFAIDSILVAVAMSPKLWVILTGGILGIIMMRAVIGRLLAVVRRYPSLVDGAFVIIAWVGIKLLIEYLHATGRIEFEVPRWLSLTFITVIFGLAFLHARREASMQAMKEKAREAASVMALRKQELVRRKQENALRRKELALKKKERRREKRLARELEKQREKLHGE